MKQLIKVISLSLFMLVLTNCNNNKSTNNEATSYKWMNGLCYNNLNQQVATTNCGNLVNSNSNYYYNANGQCVDRTYGQVVNATLCQSTTGVYGSQVCIGQYFYPANGTTGTCATTGTVNNCSGYTMISVATGQQVTCL